MNQTLYGNSGRSYHYDENFGSVEFEDEDGKTVRISGDDFRALVARYIVAHRVLRLEAMSEISVIASVL